MREHRVGGELVVQIGKEAVGAVKLAFALSGKSEQWARALDHSQSEALATMPARTGLSSTYANTSHMS